MIDLSDSYYSTAGAAAKRRIVETGYPRLRGRLSGTHDLAMARVAIALAVQAAIAFGLVEETDGRVRPVK